MGSFRLALQTNEKLFSNLVIIFELLAEKPKNIQKDSDASILIKILQFFV